MAITLSYLDNTPLILYVNFMLNIISILIGLVALIFAIPGLIPLLGIFNYVAIPIAVIGTAVGVLSSHNTGRNLCLLVLVVAVVRLWMGGFIF